MREQMSISVVLSPDQKTATVAASGRSDPLVCGVLGIEQQFGCRVIYLDALIHTRWRANAFHGWQPSGAISTILTEIKEGTS